MSGAAPRRIAIARLPLLGLGFVALFAGVGAGLARFGWPMPGVVAGAAAWHGPLMVCGFFGVVISLERAVAVGRRWAYAAPLVAGIGTVAAVHGEPQVAARAYLAGGLVLLGATLVVLHRQRANFNVVLAIAAACWPVGTAIWAFGAPPQAAVGWWVAFLVLTIAGERLELSRFMPPSPAATRVFGTIVAGLLAATAAASWRPAQHAAGVVLVALAVWLIRQDIARRTVRDRGLTRFIAVCLLSGYVWLAVGGAVVAGHGLVAAGAAWDAALHALLLGFVFAMVFGHAPIVFPAVLRVRMPYHPSFYLPLVVLHASLALRLAGDAAGAFELRRAGALGSALALAAFIANTAAAVWRGRGAGVR